jgi:hypothetical protein
MADTNAVISRDAYACLKKSTRTPFFFSSSDPVLRDLHLNTYVPLVLSMVLTLRSPVPLLAVALALAYLPLVQYS